MHSSVGSLIVMCIDFIAKKKKKKDVVFTFIYNYMYSSVLFI